jgi:prophage DNA circulation protein
MRLADLQAASFRGARFLVPYDTAEEGRNSIEHNYPDGNQRYLEDNGLESANFQITAILYGPNIRSDYARLRSALTKPGAGTLQHPWLGRQRVAVMGRYRVKRDDRDAGVLELDIPFGVTSSALFPSLLSGIPASVGGLAQAALATIFADLAARWNTGGAAGTSTTINALMDEVSGFAVKVSSGLGKRTDAAVQIIRQPATKVRSGADIQASLTALFAEPFDDLDLTGANLTAGFKAGADAVDDIAYSASRVRVRTRESQTRHDVLVALADHTRAAVYAASAWAISDREHRTAEEVEADELYLYDLARDIQNSETITAEARAMVVDIQAAISEVLADRALRTPRIALFQSGGIPAAALSYALYDTENSTDTLTDLNPDQNPIWFDGTISALVED